MKLRQKTTSDDVWRNLAQPPARGGLFGCNVNTANKEAAPSGYEFLLIMIPRTTGPTPDNLLVEGSVSSQRCLDVAKRLECAAGPRFGCVRLQDSRNRILPPLLSLPQTGEAIATLDKANYFDLIGHTAVAARSVENLVIQGNRFSSGQLPIQTNACAKTLIAGNALGVSEAEANPKTSTPQANSFIDK